ncbi:MAG: AAA family ATPase [Bacteroidetes bacterium]|nr:AAA family ATPase [Bacteroidota bacterium]
MQGEQIDIIILRGAPASGKSQSAKSLATFFPKGVRIEVDNLRNMVISPDWKNQSEHINILSLSTKVVAEFIQLGFRPIIVVDTFSGDKMNKYLEELRQLNPELSIKIFGLHVSEEELIKRIESRESWEFKDVNICVRLNGDVLKFKHDSEYQINTTGLLPLDTAKIMYEQITQ